jgi:hypothetical protein
MSCFNNFKGDFKIFVRNLDNSAIYSVNSDYIKANYDKNFSGIALNLFQSYVPAGQIWIASDYFERRQKLAKALTDLGYPVDHPKIQKFLSIIPLIH